MKYAYVTFLQVVDDVLCVVITDVVRLEVGEEVLLVGLLSLLLRLRDDHEVKLLSEVLVVVVGFLLLRLDLVIVEVVSQLLKDLMLFDLKSVTFTHVTKHPPARSALRYFGGYFVLLKVFDGYSDVFLVCF